NTILKIMHCAPTLPILTTFLFQCYAAHRDLHSFPTRRSSDLNGAERMAINSVVQGSAADLIKIAMNRVFARLKRENRPSRMKTRSEEHTSELQSRGHLVCRLLLEKKKNKVRINSPNSKTS